MTLENCRWRLDHLGGEFFFTIKKRKKKVELKAVNEVGRVEDELICLTK